MFEVSRIYDDEVDQFERLEDAWARAIRLSEEEEEHVTLIGKGVELIFMDGTAYQSISFTEIEMKLKG